MPSPIKPSKYNDAQREAVAIAYEDKRVRPAGRVAEMAARGELQAPNGDMLEPFEIRADAVRTYGARLRRGRRGELKAGLTNAPPRDAIEALRRRLISAADDALKRSERRLRSNSITTKDVEMARQIARLIREAAAIPGPEDPRPVKPGQKIPGTGANNGDRTSGGLAGTILAAHSGKGDVYTPEEDPQQSDPQDESLGGDNKAAQQAEEPEEHGDHERPGSWMREEVGAIPG
jgi:hypothetical protein